MELNVWVDNVPREVCAVDETTTAEEVIFALRDTLRMSGSFSLVAYWRGNEIVLSPSEKPLNFINRLRDNVKQFQFTLRRHEPPPQTRISSDDPRICSPPTNHPAHETSNLGFSHKTVPASPMNSTQSSPYTNNSLHNQFKNSINQDQLREQVNRQEHVVELNLDQLSKLDKEIASLEAMLQLNSGSPRNMTTTVTTSLTGGCEEVGSLAELAQLSAANWTALLEEQRIRQRQLLAEREQYHSTLEHVEEELAATRIRLTNQEAELSRELARLLNRLEVAVAQRRGMVASLTASSQQTNTHRSANRDGIMI